jgi:hypothetical protein
VWLRRYAVLRKCFLMGALDVGVLPLALNAAGPQCRWPSMPLALNAAMR